MTDSCTLITPTAYQPDKPLFLFLPGMDGTGTLLYRHVEALTTRFDLRCLRIPPDDQSSWSMLTAQVARLIRAERSRRSSRPIYLCGESFGGCLALQLVLTYPDCCDRLILVNPASSYNQQLWVRWSASLTPLLPPVIYHLSTWGLLSLLVAPDQMHQADQQTLLTAMQSVTQTSAAWRLSLLRDFAPTPTQLAQVKQPTLVIAGQRDRLLPSQAEARRLQRLLPQARTHYLPQSGHTCLLERQVKLVDILAQNQFVPQPDTAAVR